MCCSGKWWVSLAAVKIYVGQGQDISVSIVGEGVVIIYNSIVIGIVPESYNPISPPTEIIVDICVP